MKTVEEMIIGCEHDGSFIPVSEVKRLMEKYASQKSVTFGEDHNFTDLFGFEILDLKEAKSDQEKLNALEHHLRILEGLSQEAINSIESKIGEIKYPKS
jgi:DNA-directed RNA polymerase subunit F